MEPEKKESRELSSKNVDIQAPFEDDANFFYIVKKTEKLTSAIYMITNLFGDSEPMKWNLRVKSSSLLSLIISYKDTNELITINFIYQVKTKVLEIISLLEVCLVGGLISDMNSSILNQEFTNLVNLLDEKKMNIKSLSNEVLSKSFFSIPQLPLENKNQSVKDKSFIKDKVEFKRSNRQNLILGILKKKKEVTIKDIALVIRDCSEKTIQRELISFIKAGVLKRTGERRWSKYSLA